MKLNHTGLNIQSEEEVIDFYQNMLGFHFEYQFDLSAELAKDIFGLNKSVKAFLCKREDILLELFVHTGYPDKGFSHICLEVKDRESIAAKCKDNGYQVIRIERSDRPDILFVKDKGENIFELKMDNNVKNKV
jgi:catechol 2,3-dioxygenase-like lactoylglutathione lyase family enzyme